MFKVFVEVKRLKVKEGGYVMHCVVIDALEHSFEHAKHIGTVQKLSQTVDVCADSECHFRYFAIAHSIPCYVYKLILVHVQDVLLEAKGKTREFGQAHDCRGTYLLSLSVTNSSSHF